LFNDTFMFFLVVIFLIIMISIQFTLNKILKTLNDIKSGKRFDDTRHL